MGMMRTLTINGTKYDVVPVVPAASITLLANAWVGNGDVYSQVVEVPDITPHTKVDLQPTSEQLSEFHYKVLAFVAENNDGVVTVYSVGDKPTGDHTIQITKTEVQGTSPIRGNTVGTTMPRPDWNQTDPKKADYIRNKPDLVGVRTEEGGEIFNDYENNKALAPYARADGYNNRAGIYGYKLLAVAKSGENYNITVGDADLGSKARDNYVAGDVLCFDGKGHYYERLKITGLTSNADGNTVITVVPTDDGELSLLAVDSSKDEWENWIYCLDKPDVGVPVLAVRGAYAGGVGNTAIGYGAFAFGEGNKAIGKDSYAVGRDNTALYAAYVEGKGNYASGQHSHAEGYSTTASGNQSHAEGTSTTAGGASSHAEGNKTIASGVYSHAEGAYSTASGSQSHAEGSSTTASGSSSHTEGYKTIASGEVSHAEGHTTVASGLHSHAEGRGTIAAGQRQHVQGKFNVEDTKNKYAHIVGGGSSDTDRKNIHTLDWDGNAEFAGKVYAGGKELVTSDQIVTPALNFVESEEHPGCFYRMVDDEQEWLNPPLIAGVEYRTVERHDGNAVYARGVNLGSLADNGVSSVSFTRGDIYGKFRVISIEPQFEKPTSTEGQVQQFCGQIPGVKYLYADNFNTLGGCHIFCHTDMDMTEYSCFVVARYILLQ